MATPEAQEDALIRRVLAVALNASQQPTSSSGTDPVTLLGALAEDLSVETMNESASVLLSKDSLDRVIVARLIEAPPEDYPLTPFQYLQRCYSRATEESRSAAVASNSNLQGTVQACKELIVSYAGLVLTGGIIPHVGPKAEAAEQRGPLQLLDSLDAWLGFPGTPAGSQPLATDFLHSLAAKYAADSNLDGLQELMIPIVKELARRIKANTVLGDISIPLQAVRFLVEIEPVAKALVCAREFLPNLKDITGRGIESPGSSWLGPCFCPSSLDDPLIKATPNIGEQCFADVESRRPGDVQQAIKTLQMACKQVRGELGKIVDPLIKNKATRELMTGWLSGVIEGNAERGKMQWNPERGASHGFMLNHNAVMLQLAGPFLESDVFWKRVDVRYVAHNKRLDFSEDTKLSANVTEDEAWRKEQAAGAPAEYSFICECFFMTLKSLHFGLVKMLDDFHQIQMDMGYFQRQLRALQAEADRLTGTPMSMAITLQLNRAKAHFRQVESNAYCMSSVIQDPDFMGEVLAFYRLVARWLLSVANPQSQVLGPMAQGGPLPDTPPPAFTCLPEWFLEDIVDVLLMVSRHYPPLLMHAKMDDVMMLILAMMDQPKYVRSSHMRAKMAELLHVWLPQDDVQQPGRMRRFTPRGQLASTVSHLFQGHPLVCERLVPSLLRLYVDVEVMDVRNNFYEKFMYRQYIGEILAHLWELAPHRAAWKRFAEVEGTGTAGYVRFTNMLITDATYLLDESLKKVEEVKRVVARLTDPAEMSRLSPEDQRELQTSSDQAANNLRALLSYAQVTVGVMNFSTEEVTSTFLLPEMVDRTATMLNYFLNLLTGRDRRKLAVKEPEKYNFRPRELLQNLLHVYLHLHAADRQGVFCQAVAADKRSYCETMFAEAAKVLSAAQMLSPMDADRLAALDQGVQRAALTARTQEDLLQNVEVPDEFQDPIMADLMTDPVLLPTSGTIMDKSHITRHLLTDQRDPMSRAPLTPDMLIPQPDLKARIEAWIKQTTEQQLALRRQQQQ